MEAACSEAPAARFWLEEETWEAAAATVLGSGVDEIDHPADGPRKRAGEEEDREHGHGEEETSAQGDGVADVAGAFEELGLVLGDDEAPSRERNGGEARDLVHPLEAVGLDPGLDRTEGLEDRPHFGDLADVGLEDVLLVRVPDHEAGGIDDEGVAGFPDLHVKDLVGEKADAKDARQNARRFPCSSFTGAAIGRTRLPEAREMTGSEIAISPPLAFWK